MDIKILLLGLLFIFVNAFPANAGALAAAEEAIINQDSSDNNYQNEIDENKIDMARAYHRSQGIKAKKLLTAANAYSLMTNERKNYYLEYKKLAAETKEKARITEQKAVVETASLDAVEQRRKEWEVKSREAETHSKNSQIRAMQICSEAQEWNRKLDTVVISAAVAEAEASGYETIASKERQWSYQMKSRAEELLNEVTRNYCTKAKEDEQKATANKVKSQQHAEEAANHFHVARAIEAEVLKVQMASLDNLARYIALSIQAEEAARREKEHKMCAAMEEMFSSELTKRAQKIAVIIQILEKEIKYYGKKAKQQECEANVLTRSAQEVNSALVSHSASMLRLASANDDSEIEAEDQDPFSSKRLKNMPFVTQKAIE